MEQPYNTQLKQFFYKNLNIVIDDKVLTKMIQFVDRWETRDNTPLALNSYSLAIYRVYFKIPQDRDDFLALFDIDNTEFTNSFKSILLKGNGATRTLGNLRISRGSVDNDYRSRQTSGITTLDIKKNIEMLDKTTINDDWHVLSDPFNEFIPYLVHRILVAKNINERLRHTAAVKALVYLQYKFFTSVVNYYFKFAPREDLMQAMFEELSAKFDIKTYGTWKKVIYARAENIIKPGSIHYNDLIKYEPDRAVTYVISDIQTRIRNQIKLIRDEYYAVREENNRITTYNQMMTNQDGEKTISDSVNFDIINSMASNIYSDCMSPTRFIDERYLNMVCRMFSNLAPSTFRSFLISFSEYATRMHRDNKARLVKKEKDEELLLGPEILVEAIIQRCFRLCVQNDVNIKNIALVLKTVKDAFSSSRILDPGILQLRSTLVYLVLQLQESRRDVTMSALRIGLLLYIIVLGYKHSKGF